jgi:hypothetical protein
VWSELGHAYLEAGQVPDAIAAYLRSSDSSRYLAVIEACTAAGCYEDLVKYLLMVRWFGLHSGMSSGYKVCFVVGAVHRMLSVVAWLLRGLGQVPAHGVFCGWIWAVRVWGVCGLCSGCCQW